MSVDKVKCIKCGQEINRYDVICPNCNKVQGKSKVCPDCKGRILASEKVCPICGNKKFKKSKLIIVIIAVIIICLLLAVALQKVINNEEIISEKMNVDNEQAIVIKDVLKDVGITTINEIERDESLDDYYLNGGTDKGYRIAFRGHDTNSVPDTVIINITKDGKILVIKEPMGDVLYENDKVLNKIN